jgi:uncharacterized membrane protein (UPF0127 family)
MSRRALGSAVNARYKALNQTRGTVLCDWLQPAATLTAKTRGLTGHHQLTPGTGMLFSSSPALPIMWMHMFFMRFAIDIVFLDRDGRVLKIDADLKPWRVSSIVIGARNALELPAGSAKSSGTQVGDQVALQPLRPVDEV